MAKKNLIEKIYLKYTDRNGYHLYKQQLVDAHHKHIATQLAQSDALTSLSKIKQLAEKNKSLSFNHSGNAGDVIYALPVIKRIHELTNVPITLFLTLNQPLRLSPGRTHPLESVMLNEKMFGMLAPLLESQPYISACKVRQAEAVDVDLDHFRKGIVPQDKGNIAHWCAYFTGVTPQLWKPWLTVVPDTTYSDDIVIARSSRYRNEIVDYAFLSRYPNVKFIGVEAEFNDIRQYIPGIEWLKVDSFLEAAQIIAGCKLFIGNQSFPYSMAEALKVKRILEVSIEVINVVPEGENGHDVIFQDHFEELVKELSK